VIRSIGEAGAARAHRDALQDGALCRPVSDRAEDQMLENRA